MVFRIQDIELASNQRGASTAAPPLELAWTYNAGAGFGRDGPVVIGDHILVSTRNGDLHAVSVKSGRRLGIKSFGDALEAAPMVRGRTMYVPVDLGRRALYAFDMEAGNVIWRRGGASITAGLQPLETGFVSVDTRSVVRHHQGQSILWSRALDEGMFVHASPILAGGHIVVADEAGLVQGLDPEDGSIAWSTALGTPVYTAMATGPGSTRDAGGSASLPAADGLLVISTTRGRVVALHASDGRIQWDYTGPDTTVRVATAATDRESVVFGSSNGTVTSLELGTGAVQWQWKAPDAVVAAPHLNEHAVYVGSMGHMIYALDRQSGAMLWQLELRGRIKSDIVGYDDFLVVLSEPRYVYLLRAL